jgi:acyl CoA:acetate/3-ketoacid CoA transferase beta subunit
VTPEDTAALMTCRLAREIHDGDVVGVGLGTPLALAAALLARRTHAS